MGNQQVNPARSSSSQDEEVSLHVSSKIQHLECYTSKEPTFKDCFIARETWANLTKGSVRSQFSPSSKNTEEKSWAKCATVSETSVSVIHVDSHVGTSMVFFSLFFKKLGCLNPKSKLLCSDKAGYFLHALISILLMGATSVHKMEELLTVYKFVGLSEYGYIGEALMETLDATVCHTFYDSKDTRCGGVGVGGVGELSVGEGDLKKTTSAEISIVRAWNRIYSRFLRYLSGSVSAPGGIPDYLQRLVGIPQEVLAKPQYTHKITHRRRSISKSKSFPGPTEHPPKIPIGSSFQSYFSPPKR
ncbi:hypothetical protein B484DRAFT_252739, partial [Ochromonadaceae sp. CCMP2298]